MNAYSTALILGECYMKVTNQGLHLVFKVSFICIYK